METDCKQTWLESRESISDADQYIKNSHSRRSVDWRDSGIVIDDDFHLSQLELPHYDLGTAHHSSKFKPTTTTTTTNTTNFPEPASGSNYNPIEDDDGDTILHLAVVGCTQAKVLELMKICDLDAINNLMHTPLHVATLANRPEMVRLLLDNGAKPNIPDRRGDTPLHLACKKGHTDIVALLLENLKTVNITTQSNDIKESTKQYIETTNFDGLTSLHLASLNDRRDIIDMLVNKYDCNINCQDSRSGETILHKSIHQLNLGLIEYILSLEKHCNAKDYYGRTPIATIEMLLKSNVDKLQIELLETAKQLVRARMIRCIEAHGCCLNLIDCQDDEMSSSDSSSNSDFTDSD